MTRAAESPRAAIDLDGLAQGEQQLARSFKDREKGLLQELSALYTKLNQVREKRVKAEEESSRGNSAHHADNDDESTTSAGGKSRKRRRVLLVTRSLPFTLVWEDAQSQWRAEFPDNVSLDGAMETFMCMHENYDCVWIGSVHGDIEPSEQNSLKEQLLGDRNYCPVFLDPKRERLFYNGFCKTVMWPLFHSCPPTTDDQLSTHEMDTSPFGEDDFDMEKMWQAYVGANQAFADAVQEVYEEGDLVWIQGYHLTLVPQMVQNLFPNDNIDIGYFLHIPFPSSELYRIMNNREEILTGMLGADLIGFQTYEYARHFQSSAVRLLGLESSHKGVEYNGHFARVTICPVGIDADKYTALVGTNSVQEQIKQMKNQFAGKKVILGVDPLDLTKGLVHKLLAVEELFTLHPELSKEVVFLQIVTGTPSLFESPLGSQVESLVSRINSKLQDIGADGPVQYLNKEIPQEALIALYALADTLVVTPVRDGMNTIPFEYVVCREAHGKHARVVLSEFAGSAHSLGGATLVNPWNTEELLDALLASLQDNDDVMRAHESMYSYVHTFTSRHWVDNFLEQLRECSEENGLAVSGRELSRRDMTSAYIRSSRRLIFITYEGVLAAEASIPELSYPPQELIWQLSMLTKDPRNTVVLVCSRSTAVCEQWFAGLTGNIVLAAEYGVYVKWVGEHEYWHCMVPNMDMSWWEHVVPLLEYYTERTPGAFIERKDSSVAWHYRDCDLDHGLWQASELLVSLRELTRSLPVAVCPGNRVLEVRPQKASKAWLFERIWEFMNYTVLFPGEGPVTTDYFGDPVKPLSSPMTNPWAVVGGDDWRKDPPHLTPLHLGSSVNADASESAGDKEGGDTSGHGSDDEERMTSDELQPVDFLLVIASGEDRTDEDLFSYLVPAPIDLEAYCRQLEKDQFDSLSESQFGFAGIDEELPHGGSFRRLSHNNESGAGGDSASSGNFDETMRRLSPRGSFRRLLGLETSASDAESSSGLNPELLPQTLPRIPSQGPDSDILLLGQNITKLTPLYSKQAISDDAANMFPRTMLNTPSNARRDEITERSKFTPRRDFPPSAALFKAMKSKYGENFSMHRLPDTPAAAWALVVPPNARAKLEDSNNAMHMPSLGGGSQMDRKSSFTSSAAAVAGSPTSTSTLEGGGGSGAPSSVASESYGSYNSPSSSVVDGDEQMRREIEALRSLDEDVTVRSSEKDGADEGEVEGPYRFPVNTFVCTLGRKLSQAPYFIKNSADLYQLLQEMGLNSHIRKQRMMSMGSHMDE
ncbi:Trehalose-phosphatase [Globisporangium polare]